MSGQWKVFFQTVDTPPADEVLERVAQWLIKVGLATPEDCAGLVETDLNYGEISVIPERTFARRAVRMAIEAESIKLEIAKAGRAVGASQQQALVPSGVVSQPLLSADMAEVMGSDASALAIATAIQHGSKSVDVTAKLAAAGAQGLGFHLQVDSPVWQLLAAEFEAAKIDGRTAFSYVDLTSKALLPVWLPADAVGGKSAGASDWQSGEAVAGTIQSLEKALRAATKTPKFFRSLAQWTAVFSRYAVAAVSMEHLNWATVMAHIDTVMRISEEARAAGESQYLAIVYDDLVRRDWAGRAIKRDPALKIPDEALVINKEIIGIARTRLAQVLEGAGVAGESGKGQWRTSIVNGNLATSNQASIESALAKQQAAAEAVAKRAEAATRQMARQQEQLENRRMALETNGRAFQSDGGGGNRSNNHRSNKRKHDNGNFGNAKGKGRGKSWGKARGRGSR